MGAQKCWKKYDGGASKDVYKIVTSDKSRNFAYAPETKQQSTMSAFEDKTNPTKVVCGKSTTKQNWSKLDCSLEQRCMVNSEWYTTIYLE